MRIGAVILAAGASSRLGEPKQLVMLAGERLLERAVRVAAEAGCDPVIVVLGAQAQAIQAVCSLGHACVVVNEEWRNGMASSLCLGIAQLQLCDAAIMMTCDQPAVTATHLKRLMEQCVGEPVASSYGDRHGVPACFPRGHFSALCGLQGDTGARKLLEFAQAISLPGGDIDIDTQQALAAARQVFEL